MGVLKCFLNQQRNLFPSNVDNSLCVIAGQDELQKRYVDGSNHEDTDVMLSDPCLLSSSYYHVCAGDIHVLIPRDNVSGDIEPDFGVEIINDGDLCLPMVTPLQCICTPIVHVKPHGSKFTCTNPATIILPLTVCLDPNDVVTCLCSDTSINEDPVWELVHPNHYEVFGTFIKLRTTHFSFFTAVINKHYPEARKMIYAGIGGVLELPEVPGVQVTFPGSAVKYDIEATIKVMYADGIYDVDHNDPTSYALAAPVVKLGPTGHNFNHDSIKPVEIQLPLPHGKEIMDNFGRPYLTFWQSTTAEGQELDWKFFKPDYRIISDGDNRYVCFSVQHFTFFQTLWGILDSAIHEAKIGASFFYPNFEFYISFQAFMSENTGDGAFGLCCHCYRKETTAEATAEDNKIGNYPVFLGSSGLRMIKSGVLQIRIVSNLFEANTDFGEETLVQREFFTGRPFDKQFACRFIVPNTQEQSTIGKIYIERVVDSGTEPLFDFILTKPSSSQDRPHGHSNANRTVDLDHQSNWEGELSQELANILSIRTEQDLGDDVWEDIARGLGYTPLEIDMKFKDSDEPFMKLLNDYKKRGGSANDFISAMYSVGRNANLSSFEKRLRDILPSSDVREVEDDVAGCAGSISPSRTSSSSGIVLPTSPMNSRKRRHTDVPEGPVSDSKLTEVAERVQHKWKKLGRALGLIEDQIIEIEHNFKNDVQEQSYQMLLAWRERYPHDGSATLSQVLGKLGFNAVANQLYFGS